MKSDIPEENFGPEPAAANMVPNSASKSDGSVGPDAPLLSPIFHGVVVHPPPQIPDHKLVRCIGHGSYGEVWLAQSVLGEYRAVKIVYRDSFDQAKPYEREFEGLKRFEPVSHARESQVDIFHVGRNDTVGFFYYVMELADDAAGEGQTVVQSANRDRTLAFPSFGVQRPLTSIRDPANYVPRTLKHDLRNHGPWPFAEALQIALSLTRALEHLHNHALVHRDIKPSNIIFVRGVPKLADIGLVTSIDATRSFVGTDGFIPPEGPGTPQADLYSLGKVLYEVLTGKDRLDFPELPEAWRTCLEREQLPEFNEILTKACENDPKQRYQTAAEMHADLDLLQRGKSIKQERKRQRTWVFARRGIVVTAVGALLVAGLLTLVRQLDRGRPVAGNPSRQFGPQDEGLLSTNAEARALYRNAVLLMRADDQSRMGEAYTNFVKATRLDTNFVSAYVALFEMQIREGFPGMPTNRLEQIRTLAAKLKDLAPDRAETQNALSFVAWADMRYEEALKFCNRAIQDANYELGHTHYGFLLTRMGRVEEGREQELKAEQIEPSKAVIQVMLGHYPYMHREYAKALKQYTNALRFQKDYQIAHYWIGRSLRAMGDYIGAVNEFQQLDLLAGGDEIQTRKHYENLRQAFKDGGPDRYWLKELDETNKKPNTDFYWKAAVHIQLGQTEDALYWLNRSFGAGERSDSALPWAHDFEQVIFDEYWDRVRDNPDFKAFVEKIGFAKVALPKAEGQ